MANLIHQSDFSDGKKVKKSEIKEWHKRVLAALNEGAELYITASGNSMLVGIRNTGEEPGIVIYEITKGYKSFYYD